MHLEVHRILGVNEVALVELHHEVLSIRSVYLRVVYEDLMVARREEASEREPFLDLDVVSGHVRSIDGSHVRQLIVQSHVVEHVRPAVELLFYSQMVEQLPVVVLQEDLDALLQAIHQILVWKEFTRLTNRK